MAHEEEAAALEKAEVSGEGPNQALSLSRTSNAHSIESAHATNMVADQGRRRRSGCTVLTGPLFITEAFFNYIIVYSCTTSLRVRAQSVMR